MIEAMRSDGEGMEKDGSWARSIEVYDKVLFSDTFLSHRGGTICIHLTSFGIPSSSAVLTRCPSCTSTIRR